MAISSEDRRSRDSVRNYLRVFIDEKIKRGEPGISGEDHLRSVLAWIQQLGLCHDEASRAEFQHISSVFDQLRDPNYRRKPGQGLLEAARDFLGDREGVA